MEACSDCKGRGKADSDLKPCFICGGTGNDPASVCPKCWGQGFVLDDCIRCQGSGEEPEPKQQGKANQ